MFDLGQYAAVRQANSSDEYQLQVLLDRKSILHRHLGWHSPLFWLGKQPFYVLEDRDGTLLAALACPADEAGLIWLRLLAVLPGLSITRSWQRIWEPARAWLAENQPGSQVHSLAVGREMEDLLLKAGFEEISRVVALYWEERGQVWPALQPTQQIREMSPEDLPEILRIDQAAFQPLWQNTLSQLQQALSVSAYASVILLNGIIRGYQISTANSQGGHLARLAVDPAFQEQGLGGGLLGDLLNKLTAQGMVEVTVNTQQENHSSLALYRKFGFEVEEESYPVLRCRI